MKLSAILAPLIAAGVSGDVILATVKAFEEQQSDALERRRANDRERQERRRHVKSRDVTVTVSSCEGVTRGEDNLLPKKISGEDKKTNTTAPAARGVSDLQAFRSELSDLDSERLEAIVKHRRSKRGQITGHAAKLFRKDAEQCGISLAEAVDTCISRNWITVKPEYLAGRNVSAPAPRSTAPPQRERTVADALAEMASGTWTHPGERNHDPEPFTIETSFSRGNQH